MEDMPRIDPDLVNCICKCGYEFAVDRLLAEADKARCPKCGGKHYKIQETK